MKTIFHYANTTQDGVEHDHTLEADDKLVDAVAQAITSTTNAYVASVEAQTRASELRAELFRQAASGFSAIAAMLPALYATNPTTTSDPGTPRSKESEAIKFVMNSLSSVQRDRIFGTWNSEGESIAPGILTATQVNILVDVMNGKAPPSALDALVDVDSSNVLTAEQFQKGSEVLGLEKIAPLEMILGNRKMDLDQRKKSAAEAKERAEYKPEPPHKIVLEDERVAYEAMSGELVAPGAIVSVTFGVRVPWPGPAGEGWPGLPETGRFSFGPETDFKMEKITIAPGFVLTGGFVGAQNIMTSVSVEVPAEHLASDAPQPDFPLARNGICITLAVKNVTDKQLAFRGRIVGKEIENKEKA